MSMVAGFILSHLLMLSGFCLDAVAQEWITESGLPQRADLDQMDMLTATIGRDLPALQAKVDAERKKTVVIFIPGMLASKLKDPRSGKVIWGENPASVTELALAPGAPAADAPEILEEYWEDYKKMRTELAGLLQGEELILWFPYDWRQDLEWVARQLDERIKNGWREELKNRRLIIIAHSMGGLIAWTWKNRYYRKGGYDFDLWRLVLVGAPLEGSCEALYMLLSGDRPIPGAAPSERLAYRLFGEKRLFDELRPAVFTFPSVFQLLPKSGMRDPQRSCLVVDMAENVRKAVDHFDPSVWEERLLTALKGSARYTRWTIGWVLPKYGRKSVWDELGLPREKFLQNLGSTLRRSQEFRNSLDLTEEPLSKTKDREGRIRYLFSKRHSTTHQVLVRGSSISRIVLEDGGDGRVTETSATNRDPFSQTRIQLSLTHNELMKDPDLIAWLGKELGRGVVQERVKDTIALLWKDEEGRRRLQSRGVVLALSDLDIDPLKAIDDNRVKAIVDLNAEVLRQSVRKVKPELASVDVPLQANNFAKYLQRALPRVAVPLYEVALSTGGLSRKQTNYALANYSYALLGGKESEKALRVLEESWPELVSDPELKPVVLNNRGAALKNLKKDDAGREFLKFAKRAGSDIAAANLQEQKRPPEVVWNVWAEESDNLPFKRVAHLIPNSTYLLALDLSAFSYGKDKEGVVTLPPTEPFKEWLAKWLEQEPMRQTVSLTALLLPDPAYFESPAKSVDDLSVNLDKIRRLRSGDGIPVEGEPFYILAREKARGKDPDFSFGRVTFKITTRAREGHASVGFSLWKDNYPVGEVSVRLCVASKASAAVTCQGIKQVEYGLMGIDSLRVASEKAPFPDAALHFLELEPNKGMGVFRAADWPEGKYVTWKLDDSIENLHGYLNEAMLRDLALSQYNITKLRKSGQRLYELFFPINAEGGLSARNALEDFVRRHLGSTPSPTEDQPSIFVRMVPKGPNPSPMVPLGFVAVEVGETPEFLGLHFRIETPLPLQTYRSNSECASRWVLVLPPADAIDTRLQNARRPLTPRISEWRERATVHEKMDTFEEWVSAPGPEEAATALIVVSHHDRNRLFFADDDSILSRSVTRGFSKASVAILVGCGTGGPAALDFIKRFSERGMETVIATHIELEDEMAGHFIDCLTQEVERSKAVPGVTLSRTYFAALRCLRTRKSDKTNATVYEARVLLFSLLGNGNLRLCPPVKVSP